MHTFVIWSEPISSSSFFCTLPYIWIQSHYCDRHNWLLSSSHLGQQQLHLQYVLSPSCSMSSLLFFLHDLSSGDPNHNNFSYSSLNIQNQHSLAPQCIYYQSLSEHCLRKTYQFALSLDKCVKSSRCMKVSCFTLNSILILLYNSSKHAFFLGPIHLIFLSRATLPTAIVCISCLQEHLIKSIILTNDGPPRQCQNEWKGRASHHFKESLLCLEFYAIYAIDATSLVSSLKTYHAF